MKTGKLVENFKNRKIFEWNGKEYSYDEIYNLIKDLDYVKSGEDCDWRIIRVRDIKDGRDCYCLAFQDSRSTTDWIHNFMFLPRSTKAYKGWRNRLKFVKGFFKEYQSARDEIHSNLSLLLQDMAIEQDCAISALKVYVIGFSLGASIAPIACEDLNFTYGVNPVLIGYEGAECCSNNHTRNVVADCLNQDESISFVFAQDIVPRCPFCFGRKLKDFIYFLDDGTVKFPFKFIKWLVSTITKTPWYHANVDEGILRYMPWDESELAKADRGE